MSRVARMPHVYHDRQKGRYFVEQRVPDDVKAIIGKAKRKHNFPQSVDHPTANALSVGIIAKWEAEWGAVRPQPKRLPWFDPAEIIRQHEEMAEAMRKGLAIIQANGDTIPSWP